MTSVRLGGPGVTRPQPRGGAPRATSGPRRRSPARSLEPENLAEIRRQLARGGWAVRTLPDLEHIEVDPERLSGRPNDPGPAHRRTGRCRDRHDPGGVELLRDDYGSPAASQGPPRRSPPRRSAARRGRGARPAGDRRRPPSPAAHRSVASRRAPLRGDGSPCGSPGEAHHDPAAHPQPSPRRCPGSRTRGAPSLTPTSGCSRVAPTAPSSVGRHRRAVRLPMPGSGLAALLMSGTSVRHAAPFAHMSGPTSTCRS
jgi:hypothetical protein